MVVRFLGGVFNSGTLAFSSFGTTIATSANVGLVGLTRNNCMDGRGFSRGSGTLGATGSAVGGLRSSNTSIRGLERAVTSCRTGRRGQLTSRGLTRRRRNCGSHFSGLCNRGGFLGRKARR